MNHSDKVVRISLLLLEVLILVGLTILASYKPILFMVPLNIGLPILTLLFFKMEFFEKLKLSTLVFGRGLYLVAFVGIMSSDLFLKIILILLILNIAEATLTDLIKNKNYFNGLTGLCLTLSVFVFFNEMRWEQPLYFLPSKNVEAIIIWVIAYTIWNWFFVCFEFDSSIAFYHIGVLLSPILAFCLVQNPLVWLLFRANSLTMAGVFQIVNKDFLENQYKNESFDNFVLNKVKSKSTQFVGMVLNIFLIVYSVLLITNIKIDIYF